MTRRWMQMGTMACAALGLALAPAMVCAQPPAQPPQPSVGEVSTADATVSGALKVSGNRATLSPASGIVAKDRTAVIALERGGEIAVCSTSSLHLAQGKGSGGIYTKTGPLLLALDRGALEIRLDATIGDVVMTPDLRFTLHGNGPLDLRLRVTQNGDTCVENRGEKAPGLTIADQFGETTYELRPGQHVLFERGSLKEVVDHESSPCGCPPAVTVAETGVSTDADHAAAAGSRVATKQSEVDEHPFPTAVSEGLAPAPGVPQAPAGEAHAQVSMTISSPSGSAQAPSASDAADSSSQSQATSPTSPSTDTVKAQVAPPPPAPDASTFGHRIAHFFKHLFGG